MKLVRLDTLFQVKYGHSLELNKLTKSTINAGIPFVSRKGLDNGIDCYVEQIPDIEPYPAGDLTCALGGTVMATFLQERPYYTAFHVACLRPNVSLTKPQLLYYAACIRVNKFRYNYGRQANKTLKELLIPSLDSLPDWVNQTTVELPDKTKQPSIHIVTPSLDATKWKSFFYNDLFSIQKGRRLTKAEMINGSTPFIGAINSNNGVSSYISNQPIFDGNTITVNYNGNGVADAYYQPKGFWATDDVNVLYPRFKINSAIALFICALIRKEKYRYNYGRKWTLEKMNKSTIKLPVKHDGSPDFYSMENYIKSLPYSSQI